MTNENLKDTLIAAMDKSKADGKTDDDVELTDKDLEDVAGGLACAGYCNSFNP